MSKKSQFTATLYGDENAAQIKRIAKRLGKIDMVRAMRGSAGIDSPAEFKNWVSYFGYEYYLDSGYFDDVIAAVCEEAEKSQKIGITYAAIEDDWDPEHDYHYEVRCGYMLIWNEGGEWKRRDSFAEENAPDYYTKRVYVPRDLATEDELSDKDEELLRNYELLASRDVEKIIDEMNGTV